ncbi:PaaI family thioesterase [Acidisphaera sp. S103]|uniref:PaaI family thioesterase n=1 Tax=Acidisphaera sp. S103 TaxID=1747223 RepID=UPI001C2062C9|nr:PaaI family thioesterase [Acidisphaera sp. S103]
MIRERTIAWSDPKLTADASRGMSGLAFLRGMRDGSVPGAPIAALVGLSIDAVEEGRVVMRLTPAEYHYNPIGTMHGGILATLLDSVMGCAVHARLPEGRAYTSLEIKVNYVRAVTVASGELSAEGNAVHVGRRSAVAEGKVLDAKGRLCAAASTTCLVFDLPVE